MNNKLIFKWFPGLNALRISAALLVVLMHIHSNQARMDLPTLPDFPILFKGLYAVSFFFVLSGFLITYLLLKEQTKTNTVNVKAFYWRRVFRIWPLYFLVVALGMVFYWVLVPKLGLDFDVNYSKGMATALYLFFGANLMNSLFHVGGILHITWSIAVEEQFYLFWAPLAKKLKQNIESAAVIITISSLLIHTLNQANAFGLSEGMHQFVHTLQFHYMGIGAFVATKLYRNSEKVLKLFVFRSASTQVLLYTLIIAFFFGYEKTAWAELVLPLPIGVLFAWLIINTACNPKAIFKLESPTTHYLGSISYGVYMFHMPVVYAFSFVFTKTPKGLLNSPIYFVLFYGGVIAVSLIGAGISYRFLETPILKLGQQFLKRNKESRKELVAAHA